MSKVSEVFDRVVEAVEGEPPTNIMAALTAVSAMVIQREMLDRLTVWTEGAAVQGFKAAAAYRAEVGSRS